MKSVPLQTNNWLAHYAIHTCSQTQWKVHNHSLVPRLHTVAPFLIESVHQLQIARFISIKICVTCT